MNIGQGLNMIVPNLSNGNVVALGEVIQAATASQKYPKTDEDIEAVLEDIAETTGIQEYCDEILEELGKKRLTQNLVPDEYKDNKKK